MKVATQLIWGRSLHVGRLNVNNPAKQWIAVRAILNTSYPRRDSSGNVLSYNQGLALQPWERGEAMGYALVV